MNMDINVLREIVTVASFLTFTGIVAFAYRPRNRVRFDEAAQLPLDDERPFVPGQEGR
jgi:cytochrome c oxidase cbb3-type subunit 4